MRCMYNTILGKSNACLCSMNALHVQHDVSESNACLGSMMNALHVQYDMSESNTCLGSMNALLYNRI